VSLILFFIMSFILAIKLLTFEFFLELPLITGPLFPTILGGE